MAMEEEFDLYDDIFLPVNLNGQEDTKEEDGDNTSLTMDPAEMQQLKEMSTKLSSQNAALKKNISCLYKTAQLELERKESMIERLMKRIKRLEWTVKNGKSAVTKESVETKMDTQSNGTETHNDGCVKSDTTKNTDGMCSHKRDQSRVRERCSDDSLKRRSVRRHDRETIQHSDGASTHRDRDRRPPSGRDRKRSSTSNDSADHKTRHKDIRSHSRDRTSTDSRLYSRQRSSTAGNSTRSTSERSRSRDRLPTRRRVSSSHEPKDQRSLSRHKAHTLPDGRVRKRSLISREREELRRADLASRREKRSMRLRSDSPLGRRCRDRDENRTRSEYLHREECVKRQNRSHDKENRELGNSRADRKRRHSRSPEHTHSGPTDLRVKLECKTKRFKREPSPKVDRTERECLVFSPRGSMTHSGGDYGSCPPTPSYEELEESEFLELEFDDLELYQCSEEELSCPPTPTSGSMEEIEPCSRSERSHSVSEDETVPGTDCDSETGSVVSESLSGMEPANSVTDVSPTNEYLSEGGIAQDDNYLSNDKSEDYNVMSRQEVYLHTYSNEKMEGVEVEEVLASGEFEITLSDHEDLEMNICVQQSQVIEPDSSNAQADTTISEETATEADVGDNQFGEDGAECNVTVREEDACGTDADTDRQQTVNERIGSTTTEQTLNEQDPEVDYFNTYPANSVEELNAEETPTTKEPALPPVGNEKYLQGDPPCEGGEDLCGADSDGCLSDEPSEGELEDGEIEKSEGESETIQNTTHSSSLTRTHTDSTRHHRTRQNEQSKHSRTNSSSHCIRLSSDCSKTRATSRHSHERASEIADHHRARVHTTRPLEPSRRTNTTHRSREPSSAVKYDRTFRHSRELANHSRPAIRSERHRSSRHSSSEQKRRDNRRC